MVELKLKLPDSFFFGEERDGYFVSPEMKKVWAVELDLLAEFMRVCEKYKIQWWADAGTILGAARHKGFIPWDDDIDVMMMRDEYNRFIEVSKEEFKYPYCLQYGYETYHCHMQLRNSLTTGIIMSSMKEKFPVNQGIFIDIFPIDVKTDNEKDFKDQSKKIEKIKNRAYLIKRIKIGYPFQYNGKIKFCLMRFFLHYLLKLVRIEKYDELPLLKEVTSLATKYNNHSTQYVCKFVLIPMKPRRIWEKEWFSATVYLPFEMFKLPVPVGYEKLLDRFYGNWHKYVIGTATHGSVFFDTDKPYTEYIHR